MRWSASPTARPNALASICFEAGRLRRAFALARAQDAGRNLFDLARAPALRGAHNGQNAAAAFAACERLGWPHDEIGLGMRSFPGLAHRMEQIGRKRRNVLFVNDSKATNADAAEKALQSFDPHFLDPRRQGQGGRHRAAAAFVRQVAKAYLIGEAAPDFARRWKATSLTNTAGRSKSRRRRRRATPP